VVVAVELLGLLLFRWGANDSPGTPRRPGRGRPWPRHGKVACRPSPAAWRFGCRDLRPDRRRRVRRRRERSRVSRLRGRDHRVRIATAARSGRSHPHVTPRTGPGTRLRRLLARGELDTAIASLEAHRADLSAFGPTVPDARTPLTAFANQGGQRFGGKPAMPIELIARQAGPPRAYRRQRPGGIVPAALVDHLAAAAAAPSDIALWVMSSR
jgi:hypothetical protein